MSRYVNFIALFCFILFLSSNGFPIATNDYDWQNNPIDLSDYGYSNPFEGFVGSLLAQPFYSSHYFIDAQHTGADFMVSSGTELKAIFSGTVIESKDFDYQKDVNNRNNYYAYFNSRIIIKSTNPQEPNNSFLIIYAHVKNSTVSEGDVVMMGGKIGEIADAYDNPLTPVRDSSNDHLHLGININNSIYYGEGWGFGIAPGTASLQNILDKGFRDPFQYLSENSSFPLWDVQNDTAWFYSYVHCLFGLGIINGHPDGSFRPGDEVNRVEFIKMVVIALEMILGHEIVGFYPASPPWNIDPSHWYYTYVMKAYLYKNFSIYPPERIAFWYTDQSLDFSQGVTREEAAHIVRNALSLPPYNLTSFPAFSDVAIDSIYAPWIYKIREAGIIDGYKDNTFQPSNVLNRAEAVKIIRNMLKYKEYINYTSTYVYPDICNKEAGQ